MKKITTTLFLMACTLGFAQQQTYDLTFESGSTLPNWNTFENGTGSGFEQVANPVSGGINTSATVAKYTAAFDGNPWAGCETVHGEFGTWKLEAENTTLTIMVYKSEISDVGVKFGNKNAGSVFELKKPNTKINEWETLVFDISSGSDAMNLENMDIDQVVIFPDWQTTRAQDNVCYFDNISFTAYKLKDPFVEVIPTEGPADAAPNPTRPATNVISLFSNAYTNVGVDTWRTSWSVADLTDVQIAGNDVKKYSKLNYVGIETTGANLIDASTMQYFHLDVWTPNLTTFKVKLVDYGADGVFGGTDNSEFELSFTPTTLGWNSYDLLLSDFTGLTNKGHIAQLIFSGNPVGTGVVYVDNIYFSDVALSTKGFAAAQIKMFPNPASNSLNIQAQATIENVSLFTVLGQKVLDKSPNIQNVNLDISNLQRGVYVVKTTINGKTATSKVVKE